MASTSLSRTFTETNRKTFTISVWVKRSSLGDQKIFGNHTSNDYYAMLHFNSSDQLQFYNRNASTGDAYKAPSMKFRDTNGWYHIVVAVDTTQSTANDRIKFYINGELQTSFAENSAPAQNYICRINGALAHYVGQRGNSAQYFDGLMSHFHFIDGTAYAASDFGSTDSTTGIWKPKTSPSVSYGTNGYFLDFADSSAMGDDESGNTNDFTVSGTMTQTIDTPSNVFATWNALVKNTSSAAVFANGNTKVTPQDNTTRNHGITTLGFSKGKYYCEIKWNVNDNVGGAGVLTMDNVSNTWQGNLNVCVNGNAGGASTSIGRVAYRDDGNIHTSTLYKSTGASMTNGDILGIAFDATNGKIYFHKNGTYVTTDSVQHNPSAGTGGIDISGESSWQNGTQTWGFYCGDGSTNGYTGYSANFGNGYFDATAVASAGTNSGIGTFEYDVPSGYKALCTKNINEQEYS